MENFKPGDKVTYSNGHTKLKGIVKEVRDGRMYVVYGLKTASDWRNYRDFSGSFTPVKFLKIGWK